MGNLNLVSRPYNPFKMGFSNKSPFLWNYLITFLDRAFLQYSTCLRLFSEVVTIDLRTQLASSYTPCTYRAIIDLEDPIGETLSIENIIDITAYGIAVAVMQKPRLFSTATTAEFKQSLPDSDLPIRLVTKTQKFLKEKLGWPF